MHPSGPTNPQQRTSTARGSEGERTAKTGQLVKKRKRM